VPPELADALSSRGGEEIAGVIPGGNTLRQASDRSILPVAFLAHELRSNDVGR
jgi:hypothetical protein